MKVFITAKAGAKEEKVEKIDDTHFRVWVKAPPEKGKANETIRGALAGHLDIPKSTIVLVSGKSSKRKVFQIG
ncbi:MAG: DUF167 domain-containing protein [Parcubacteria group bacterium]